MVAGHLDSVAGLRRDALHGEDDLELHLAGEVARRDLPQRRLLVYLVRHDDRPEHLEEILCSVNLGSEVHSF